MESIIQEEKHIACRYCGGIVYESHPICSKCGLGMSSEGIIDLAKIEEETLKALDEMYKLRMTSIIYLAHTIVGFAFAYALELKFFFHLYFWIGFTVVFLSFIGWNRKYLTINFAPEDAEIVKKNKRETLLVFFCNLIIGFGIYIFLNLWQS